MLYHYSKRFKVFMNVYVLCLYSCYYVVEIGVSFEFLVSQKVGLLSLKRREETGMVGKRLDVDVDRSTSPNLFPSLIL